MEDKEVLVYKIKVNELFETVRIPMYYDEGENLDYDSPIIGMNGRGIMIGTSGHGKGGFLRSKDIQEALKSIDEKNI